MSENNGFADKSAFQKAVGKTRYRVVSVPLVGSVRIRSLNALDYSRIQAYVQRQVMAAHGDKRVRQEKALAETTAEIIRLCVVDGEGNPVFSESDRETLLTMDASVTAAIESAAMEFCGMDGADLETIAKNSATTLGDSSQSG